MISKFDSFNKCSIVGALTNSDRVRRRSGGACRRRRRRPTAPTRSRWAAASAIGFDRWSSSRVGWPAGRWWPPEWPGPSPPGPPAPCSPRRCYLITDTVSSASLALWAIIWLTINPLSEMNSNEIRIVQKMEFNFTPDWAFYPFFFLAKRGRTDG